MKPPENSHTIRIGRTARTIRGVVARVGAEIGVTQDAAASFFTISKCGGRWLRTPFERNAEGRLQLTILAAFAAYFSDMLAKHTSKGKGERTAQGLYNGDVPLRMLNRVVEYDEVKGIIVIENWQDRN